MNTTSYQKFLKGFFKFTEDYNKELLEKLSDKLSLTEEQKQQAEELMASLIVKPDTSTKSVVKKKREPTAYNLFMKDMIKELREKHPEIDKTELMKRGAAEWQKQKANNATK
jgi:hypothetical protein